LIVEGMLAGAWTMMKVLQMQRMDHYKAVLAELQALGHVIPAT
jgi:hypothetical protein